MNICNAQNLVPNGDFEQYSSCPTAIAQFDSLLNWFNPCLPPYGINPNESGSPDYFNTCSVGPAGSPFNFQGFQPAHSGNGYCGIIIFDGSWLFREYIEVPLVTSLIAGVSYHFQMFVSLSNDSRFATESLGIYFTDSPVAGLHNHTHLPFIPQISNSTGLISDTLNWQIISGDYTAIGGENHIIIGNFNDNNNTNFVNVNNGLYGGTYIFIDDVSLTPTTGINESINTADILITNPFCEIISIKSNLPEEISILIYDLSSCIVANKKFTNSTTINTNHLAGGLYHYEVRCKSGRIKRGKIVKY